MSERSIIDFFSVIQDENSGSNDEEGRLLDRIVSKTPRSLLLNNNCTLQRKTLLSACSRIHNQNNVLFSPSFLKIRARHLVLCLYSHNYFEQEIKNAVFFAQFTYVSRSYVLVRT